MSITENIENIKKNIEKARKKNNQEVTLVAVTKTVDHQVALEAIACGIEVIGENRVQEVLNKYPYIEDKVKWHLIGSLQTNKVKYIIDKVDLIHSLDRMELALEIDKKARQYNKIMEVLVQVNISRENTKHGLFERDVLEFIEKIAKTCDNIKVVGLMGMAPFEIEKEETRPYFRTLKKLFLEVQAKNIPRTDMKHLSMGMSNDYEIAIEEGATIVRIGTSIFSE